MSWVEDKSFLGTWAVPPTKYYPPNKNAGINNIVIAASDINSLASKASAKPKAEFRVMAAICVERVKRISEYHRPPVDGKFKPKPEGYKQAGSRLGQ